MINFNIHYLKLLKLIPLLIQKLWWVSDKSNLIQRIKVICKRSVRDHYAKKENIKWQHTFIRDYNRFISCHTMYNTLGCHLKITEKKFSFSLGLSIIPVMYMRWFLITLLHSKIWPSFREKFHKMSSRHEGKFKSCEIAITKCK